MFYLLNSSANNNLQINAVSGLILKNHPKSYFRRFHLKSSFADQVLCNQQSTIVLQMMVCGDMEVIAELVKKEDYEVVSNG